MVFLFYTFTVTPYTIAFIDVGHPAFAYITALDIFVDCVFFIDIIVNFFIAYYDDNYKLVDSHWRIAFNYLTTWFLVDFFSILPFSIVFDTLNNYSALGRLSRVSKLYKIVKMAKLL